MKTEAMQRVRSFNRTVTQRLGALDHEYLARSRPLGASRVLWEIGDGGIDLRQLRTRLDLDSGYLSRLLRLLEGEGLVAVEPSASDKRARLVRLRAAGAASESSSTVEVTSSPGRSSCRSTTSSARDSSRRWPSSSGCSRQV